MSSNKFVKIKLHTFLSICFCCIMLYCPSALASLWNIEVVDNSGVYGGVSLGLTSNGTPHIAYKDYDEGARLKHAFFNGAKWISETLISPTYVDGISLAISGNDEPLIAYGDNNLRFASFNGSTWAYEIIDSHIPYMISMALDPAGQPRISYWDNSIDNSLRLASFNGSGWDIQLIGNGVGPGNSLVIDASGTPHISYQEQSNAELRYAVFNGTGWDVQEFSGLFVEMTSLALDHNMNPHLAFYESGTGSLIYGHCDGSDWVFETVDYSSQTQPTSKSLALVLDNSDNVHISYVDNDSRFLNYAFYDGTTWTIETVDDMSIGAYHSSIFLDAHGNPNIAYCTGGDLKFARVVPEPSTLLLLGLGAVRLRSRQAAMVRRSK